MQKALPEIQRSLPNQILTSDVVVVGGGVAGVCFAIAAARGGARVILVQDRPVLGGNASSEVRLWMNGATSHGYNNNRWAREGGIMNEIMMLNVYRNPGGNPVILDTIFFELALAEPNLTLLLNTSVYAVEKDRPDLISAVRGFNSQNQTFYELRAPVFCDASGDGVVGFLAGGAFRMGAEDREEFGEAFAPPPAYGELLGHSIFFYSKDAGRPVPYLPPSYALPDVEKAIPRYRNLRLTEDGCQLWWIEFGGRLDTVFETEQIKWELWRIVYGVWNYFKNSGKFPEAKNLTLEWVGTVPGKRESRRFEGDYMLTQRDLVEQRQHEDDVAYGGWALDLHPGDGVYSDMVGCTHYHSKGPYPVPYRTMYSRNLENLFLAGRVLSCSHVAFASLRNMASLGYCGQAAGVAAALCVRKKLRPVDLSHGEGLQKLQHALLKSGQHIRGRHYSDPVDLAPQAEITASSEFSIRDFPADGDWISLRQSVAQMLPLSVGPAPEVTFRVRAKADTVLKTCLMISSKIENHTPDQILGDASHTLRADEEREITISCPARLPEAQYGFYALLANEAVDVRGTTLRATGLLAVFHHNTQRESDMAGNKMRPSDLGVEEFELWSPRRRPEGQNLALRLTQPLKPYAAAQVVNGVYRPTSAANAWVADPEDSAPTLTVRWTKAKKITRIVLDFDPDWDHPMESVIKWHSEQAMPFTVRDFEIEVDGGKVVKKITGNFQARNDLRFVEPISASHVTVRILAMNGKCAPALFGVSVYS